MVCSKPIIARPNVNANVKNPQTLALAALIMTIMEIYPNSNSNQTGQESLFDHINIYYHLACNDDANILLIPSIIGNGHNQFVCSSVH
jgi:hypothetical protein